MYDFCSTFKFSKLCYSVSLSWSYFAWKILQWFHFSVPLFFSGLGIFLVAFFYLPLIICSVLKCLYDKVSWCPRRVYYKVRLWDVWVLCQCWLEESISDSFGEETVSHCTSVIFFFLQEIGKQPVKHSAEFSIDCPVACRSVYISVSEAVWFYCEEG